MLTWVRMKGFFLSDFDFDLNNYNVVCFSLTII